MKIGQTASLERKFTQTDVAAYADLTGRHAKSVPEPMIGVLFSTLLGTLLPGPGTNYLKQEMRYVAGAPFGIPLTATITLTRLREVKRLADFATECRMPDGTLICEGRALVKYP